MKITCHKQRAESREGSGGRWSQRETRILTRSRKLEFIIQELEPIKGVLALKLSFSNKETQMYSGLMKEEF
jgi:hypothetical protein